MIQFSAHYDLVAGTLLFSEGYRYTKADMRERGKHMYHFIYEIIILTSLVQRVKLKHNLTD